MAEVVEAALLACGAIFGTDAPYAFALTFLTDEVLWTVERVHTRN